MPSRIVTVGASCGLHARPATLVSRAASHAAAPVRIGRVGQEAVDAGSILSLMGLGIGAGERVEISSEDEAGLAQVAELVASGAGA